MDACGDIGKKTERAGEPIALPSPLNPEKTLLNQVQFGDPPLNNWFIGNRREEDR
jgi:hypothetical protein